MLKKWGILLLAILLAAVSAGSAELIQITLADGASECGSEAVVCEGDVVTIRKSGQVARMLGLAEFMCPECRRIRREQRASGYEEIPL